MKIKVSELTLTQLDYSVARVMCIEVNIALGNIYPNIILFKNKPDNYRSSSPNYSPTSDWLFGGAVIDWCEMEFRIGNHGVYANLPLLPASFGADHLIAAMRAAVIDCFGAEVEIPDELMGM